MLAGLVLAFGLAVSGAVSVVRVGAHDGGGHPHYRRPTANGVRPERGVRHHRPTPARRDAGAVGVRAVPVPPQPGADNPTVEVTAVDSVTGRRDRPDASSAVGSVTVVVS